MASEQFSLKACKDSWRPSLCYKRMAWAGWRNLWGFYL